MSPELTELELAPSEQTRRLRHAKRLFAVLSAVNRAITRKLGRRELLHEICRILVDIGEFRMAWFGIADSEGWVVPHAIAGDTMGYLATIKVSNHDIPEGHGPTGISMRENRPVIYNNILSNPDLHLWHGLAQLNGFNSSAGFPVFLPSGDIASLNLYSTESDFFSSDEDALIQDICAGIGYALEFSATEERRIETAAQLARTQTLAKVGGWSADLLTGMCSNTAQASIVNGLPSYPIPWEMFADLIDPADASYCWDAWEHAISTGEPYDVEHRIVVDGVTKWVHNLAEIECDVNGHPVRVVGMTQDITERKTAQEMEERFRVIFENATEGIIVTALEEHDGALLMANPAGCAMFGYSEADFLNLSVPDLHPSEALLEVLIQIDALATGKKTMAGALPCRRRDGVLFYANVAASPMTLQGKKCLVGFFSDITELKHAEDELLKQQQQLEELNSELTKLVVLEVRKNRAKELELIESDRMASLGQLAAGIAHEINNPMAFITSNLGTLSEFLGDIVKFDQAVREISVDLPPPAGEMIDSIRDSLGMEYLLTEGIQLIDESLEGACRVTKIVRDLKTFARDDACENDLADLASCMESALTIAYNDLKYVANIRKEFGPRESILCHPGKINQVFMNLLINAGQAIEPPGEIVLKSWSDENFVYASVGDTGKGIPEENIQRLFEPFFTTKAVGKGTGLGLSIAYEIVKKHNGTILVESQVGKGTTFTVKIAKNVLT